MKKDIREKWVAALRSGEYKQTTEVLRSHDYGFCCLGVLCDLYKKETGQGEWRRDFLDSDDEEETELDTYNFIAKNESSSEVLPYTVQQWANITEQGDLTKAVKSLSGLEIMMLSSLNDRGFTFAQIADIIEKEGSLKELEDEQLAELEDER